MQLDERFLTQILADAFIVQGKLPSDPSFCVDTRTLQPGEIFIALRGELSDGHDFLADALSKGAQGIVIAHEKRAQLASLSHELLQQVFVLAVNDPLQALYSLAKAWRAHCHYPVVGITGSIGKTSTKELLSNILQEAGLRCLSSRGNQNTKIGLSLNMLRMKTDDQVAVFEMGINKRGEMVEMADLLRPTIALITSIGHSHMEGLGSISDIALEKRSIFKFFSETSIGIINGDQALLSDVGYMHPVIKFGSKTTNQIQARKINIGAEETSFIMKIYKKRFDISVKTIHEGTITIILAATAAAQLLGVADHIIVKAISKPLTIPSRFEQKSIAQGVGKGLLIDDCYNANPESMKAALLAFQRIKTNSKKIAILGDMLELGTNSQFWHRQLGRFLRKVPSVRQIILVGTMVQWTKKTLPIGVSVEVVPNWQAALAIVRPQLEQESLLLVKASQGMGLKNLVKELV